MEQLEKPEKRHAFGQFLYERLKRSEQYLDELRSSLPTQVTADLIANHIGDLLEGAAAETLELRERKPNPSITLPNGAIYYGPERTSHT